MDMLTLKKAKDDLALHVALLMREGKTKATAQVIAYAEGQALLDRRLGQQSLLPLMEADKPKAA